MKVYRIYVNSVCVGTVFSLAQVVAQISIWIQAGYNPTFKEEEK